MDISKTFFPLGLCKSPQISCVLENDMIIFNGYEIEHTEAFVSFIGNYALDNEVEEKEANEKTLSNLYEKDGIIFCEIDLSKLQNADDIYMYIFAMNYISRQIVLTYQSKNMVKIKTDPSKINDYEELIIIFPIPDLTSVQYYSYNFQTKNIGRRLLMGGRSEECDCSINVVYSDGNMFKNIVKNMLKNIPITKQLIILTENLRDRPDHEIFDFDVSSDIELTYPSDIYLGSKINKATKIIVANAVDFFKRKPMYNFQANVVLCLHNHDINSSPVRKSIENLFMKRYGKYFYHRIIKSSVMIGFPTKIIKYTKKPEDLMLFNTIFSNELGIMDRPFLDKKLQKSFDALKNICEPEDIFEYKKYDKKNCSICLEEIGSGEAVKFPCCGVKYHKDCVVEYFQVHFQQKCPICRMHTYTINDVVKCEKLRKKQIVKRYENSINIDDLKEELKNHSIFIECMDIECDGEGEGEDNEIIDVSSKSFELKTIPKGTIVIYDETKTIYRRKIILNLMESPTIFQKK